MPPEAEQDERHHNGTIMFNILLPPTGTSTQSPDRLPVTEETGLSDLVLMADVCRF